MTDPEAPGSLLWGNSTSGKFKGGPGKFKGILGIANLCQLFVSLLTALAMSYIN